MSFQLNRFKIKTRIFTGFAIPVVFAGILAGFGVWQLTRVDDQVQQLSSTSKNALHVIDAMRSVETLTRATTDARGDGSDASIKKFADTTLATQQLLKDLS